MPATRPAASTGSTGAQQVAAAGRSAQLRSGYASSTAATAGSHAGIAPAAVGVHRADPCGAATGAAICRDGDGRGSPRRARRTTVVPISSVGHGAREIDIGRLDARLAPAIATWSSAGDSAATCDSRSVDDTHHHAHSRRRHRPRSHARRRPILEPPAFDVEWEPSSTPGVAGARATRHDAAARRCSTRSGATRSR